MSPEKVTYHKIAAVSVSVLILAPLLWMLLDRDPPYTRLSGRVLPEDPKQGDFITVDWKIEVHRNCPPSRRLNVSRRVIDATGKHHDYEPVEGVFGTVPGPPLPGITRGFQLPPDIAIGSARYQSSACFACNPVQNLFPVCIDQPEINFTIRPKD